MLKLYTPETKLPFGKYKDMTVEEIIEEDPQYIAWCHHNVDGFNVTPTVANMVNEAVAEREHDSAASYMYQGYPRYPQYEEDFDYDDPFLWEDPLNW